MNDPIPPFKIQLLGEDGHRRCSFDVTPTEVAGGHGSIGNITYKQLHGVVKLIKMPSREIYGRRFTDHLARSARQEIEILRSISQSSPFLGEYIFSTMHRWGKGSDMEKIACIVMVS